MVAFFGLSVAAIRNSPLFFWVALPVAAAAVRDLLSSRPAFQARSTFPHLPPDPGHPHGDDRFFCVGARVLTRALLPFRPADRPRGLGDGCRRFPVQASEFAAQNHLTAPLVERPFPSGAGSPGKGLRRSSSTAAWSVMQEDLFTPVPGQLLPRRGFRPWPRAGISVVLFGHMMSAPWFNQLKSMPDWRLVYFDDVDALSPAGITYRT